MNVTASIFLISLFLGNSTSLFSPIPQSKKSGSTRTAGARVLPNNVVIENSPTVSLRVSFRVGSSADPKAMAGLTHLTGRYLVELTKANHPELFALGAQITVQVDKDQLVLVGRVHRDQLNAFLPIFESLFSAPKKDEALFGRLKQQALHQLKKLQSADIEALGKEWIQSLIYANHPYQHPTVGTTRGLTACTLSALVDHFETHFCTDRMLWGAAGPLPKDGSAQLTARLNQLQSSTCTSPMSLPSPTPTSSPSLTLLNHPAAASAGIHMGWALGINRSHEDYPALLLASAYLGQHRQFNGTLMQKVRVQRGLNYGTYAYAEHFAQDGDTRFPLPNTARRQQYFSIWLRPVATQNAAFATALVHHELKQLVKNGITARAFSDLKQFAKRYFSLYLQSQSRRVWFALDDAFYKTNEPFRQRLHRSWDTLTVNQFNAVIRRHLNPNSVTIGIITSDVPSVKASFTQAKLQQPHYATEVSQSIRREDTAVLRHSLSFNPKAITVVSATDLF